MANKFSSIPRLVVSAIPAVTVLVLVNPIGGTAQIPADSRLALGHQTEVEPTVGGGSSGHVVREARETKVLGGWFTTAPRARTANPTNCGECYFYFDGDDYWHRAGEFTSPKSGRGPGYDEPTEWHPGNFRSGDCLMTHGFCFIIWMDERRDPEGLSQIISEAAGKADVEVLAALTEIPAVNLVASRSAIQVTGCDGVKVVGHVPIAPDILEAIRQAVSMTRASS